MYKRIPAEETSDAKVFFNAEKKHQCLWLKAKVKFFDFLLLFFFKQK